MLSFQNMFAHPAQIRFGHALALNPSSTENTSSSTSDVFKRSAWKDFASYQAERAEHNRTTLTTENIARLVAEAFTKACDDLDIPEELRPKLVVNEDPRYLSEDAINAILEETFSRHRKSAKPGYTPIDPKIVLDGKKPIDFTGEELSAKAVQALRRSYESLGYPEKTVNFLSDRFEFPQASLGGAYSPSNHTVSYTAFYVRNWNSSIESTIEHEVFHAYEMLLLALLSNEDRKEYMQQELLEEVQHGLPGKIMRKGPNGSFYTGKALLKISPAMQQDISQLLRDVVLADADAWAATLENGGDYSYSPTEQTKPREAYDDLKKNVTNIVEKYPDFVAYFPLGKGLAIDYLMTYLEEQLNRFRFATRFELAPEIQQKVKSCAEFQNRHHQQELKHLLHKKVIQSQGERWGELYSYDEEVRIPPYSPHHYFCSPGEVRARVYAAKRELRNIETQLSDGKPDTRTASILQVRREQLELGLERDKLAIYWRNIYQQLLKNPDNEALRTRADRIYTRFEELYQLCEQIDKLAETS